MTTPFPPHSRRFLAQVAICLALSITAVRAADEVARLGGGADKPTPNGSSSSTVAQTNSMLVLNDAIKLGIGDRISYRIVEERRDPVGLFITESGEMEIPLIGRVMAVGKTCKQLAFEIKPLMEKDYFYHATVILGLDSIGTKARGRIYITGQVRNQGGMDIMPDEELTVSKAILKAGGIADFGNGNKVKLIRKSPGSPNGTTTTILNVNDILKKGLVNKDVAVEPGDMIVVPEKYINL